MELNFRTLNIQEQKIAIASKMKFVCGLKKFINSEQYELSLYNKLMNQYYKEAAELEEMEKLKIYKIENK